jgi:short-subunit dehydrogenase
MKNCIEKSDNDRLLGLFGLGLQFEYCYRQLVLSIGREPDFLCDNDPDKWGREFFGKKCIPPAGLRELSENTEIVITVRRYEDIYRQLREMGLKKLFVACFDQGYDLVRCVRALGPEPFECEKEPSMISVEGRWTLITGAARGIGRQIALAMASLGSNIIAHSRDVSHTKELIADCVFMGVEALPIAAELGSLKKIEEMLDNLEHGFPAIDIVFNNAGISLACGPDPWSISSKDYLGHYTINTVAPIRICYRLIPAMIERGFGRVINISSTIQKRPSEMAYSCSKAALSKFVHDLAPILEGTGVMISLVCPGHVRSDMGGMSAPHAVESVIPGALLGALSDSDVNGKWFIAQDYTGLSLPAALKRAKFYYNV